MAAVTAEITCEDEDVKQVETELLEWFFDKTSIGMDNIKITNK